MSENWPSKMPATDQPLSHFISAAAVTSAEFGACAAPNTVKGAAPGSETEGAGTRWLPFGAGRAAKNQALGERSA